jgi:protein-S-isoprenylcysteine O-methyltransferase Ste14
MLMTIETRKYSLGQFIGSTLVSCLFFPLLILGLGGNWRWVEGWIFALWFDAMMLSITGYMYVKDPALLAERAQAPGAKNQKAWDKYLLWAVYFIAMAWLIIMPLDAERFHWSPPFPLWLKVLGFVALLPALYFMVQATVENTYLSTLVRIQSERKQHVISSGVYGIVRHPLYFGCLLMMLGGPLLLGSVYGLVLTLVGTVMVIGRIFGEEKMLTEELDGYEEYKEKVRFRLIPFVW